MILLRIRPPRIRVAPTRIVLHHTRRTIATAVHLADRIPWNALVSNLQWKQKGSCESGRVNLSFRFDANQSESLNQFVDSFLRVINEEADGARRKLPTHFNAPSPDEVIISDDVARKISPTVRAWHARHWPRPSNTVEDYLGKGLEDRIPELEREMVYSHYNDTTDCKCTLPLEERKMSAFLRQYKENDCFCFEMDNREAFFNLEVLKTLLIQGEIETVLKICAHSDVDYEEWWSRSECGCSFSSPTLGWDKLYKFALRPYITLNVLLHFPELWNWDAAPSIELNDYRRLLAYQDMVLHVTKQEGLTEVSQYPHLKFFGIGRDQFSGDPNFREPKQSRLAKYGDKLFDRHPTGLVSYEEFLRCEIPSTTSTSSIPIPEVFNAPSHLPMPHHPFHPKNRQMLQQYLEYCWQLVIRCALMGRALDCNINLEIEMLNSIIEQLGSCSCCLESKRRLKYKQFPDPDIDHFSPLRFV